MDTLPLLLSWIEDTNTTPMPSFRYNVGNRVKDRVFFCKLLPIKFIIIK